MLQTVSAKINLGLNILRRRPDGYHELQTVFYPVGRHNGTPANPEAFCDVLEIVPSGSGRTVLTLAGDMPDCRDEDNLVWKAHGIFAEEYLRSTGAVMRPVEIYLEKHLPFGAGLGGGSADASFTLRMLNELSGCPFGVPELERMALRLGADCPVFVRNEPAYAEGVGERLRPMPWFLDGWWCLIVKPPVAISTKEAFAGIVPCEDAGRDIPDLRAIVSEPVGTWRDRLTNDFEQSLFPSHPILAAIKSRMYSCGATYAAMSGSGSAIFGLFDSRPDEALAWLSATENPVTLAKL